MEVGDLTIVDGEWSSEGRRYIIVDTDTDTAAAALAEGEAAELLETALRVLFLTDKQIVVVQQQREDA